MTEKLESFTNYMQNNGVACFELEEGQLKPLNTLGQQCSIIIHDIADSGSTWQVSELLRSPDCHEKITKLLSKNISVN